jgi:hypothetical protein
MGIRGQLTEWDNGQLVPPDPRPASRGVCAERGIVTPATICDHVEPHHGDVCHDSTKRFVTTHGFRPDIGLDGMPLDPRHPVYSRER